MRTKDLLALITVLATAGCTNVNNAIVVNPTRIPTLAQGESPLATPNVFVSPLEDPQVPFPTQSPSMASIEGKIVMEGHAAGLFPASLYLGDPTGSQPPGAYIALNTDSAPEGYIKPDGSFVFPNVPTGIYAIVVWTPSSAYIVPHPLTGQTWLIQIEGAERFDAGTIQVPKQ
jgi:hypothetical protein